MKADVSFDTAIDPPHDRVAGTYRLPGGPWRAFYLVRHDVSQPWAETSRQDGEVRRLLIHLPRLLPMDQESVLHFLGHFLRSVHSVSPQVNVDLEGPSLATR